MAYVNQWRENGVMCVIETVEKLNVYQLMALA
jgi:hypothetical protein